MEISEDDQNKPNQDNVSNQNNDIESEHESEINSKISNTNSSQKKTDSFINKSRDIEILPETTDKCDLSFKIIIIGDSFVGKSSLANKAVKNKFDELYSATLGFDYFSFFVKIDGKILKLQIWDTCGQEIYQSLITNFYRNSSLAIMIYAINNRSSFEHIDNWLKAIKINSNPDAKIFLIGNKADLEDEREVTYEEAENYANELDFSKFFEASAKSGLNAQKIFIEAANILYEDYIDYKSFISHNTSNISESSVTQKINITNESSKKSHKSKSKECC
jgi:small GTP-binding protein